MFFTTLLTLASASVAFAAPAPISTSCAVCPSNVNTTSITSALDGTSSNSTTTYYLVNRSNSGPGTPTYCGYNTDETHPWYQVFCFYSPNGQFYSSSDGFQGCPASTTTAAC